MVPISVSIDSFDDVSIRAYKVTDEYIHNHIISLTRCICIWGELEWGVST